MNETEVVVYECGCEVRIDGVVFPCETAKRIFDERSQEKLDAHFDMREYSAKG